MLVCHRRIPDAGPPSSCRCDLESEGGAVAGESSPRKPSWSWRRWVNALEPHSLRVVGLLWLLTCSLLVPSQSHATEMAAANLGSGADSLAPDLVALAQLDQRIAANQDPKQRQHLELQHHLVLERLTGRIFAGDSASLAPAPSAEKLRQLREAVAQARQGGDREREMIALLALNTAVLDAAFARLLHRLATLWSSFASADDFDRAFATFGRQTTFDQAPVERAVDRIDAQPSAERSATDLALMAAYQRYQARASTYDAVVKALQDYLIKAAGGDPLLRWIGVGDLIAAVDQWPGVPEVNAALFSGRHFTLGQIVVALAVFALLTLLGLLVVPLVVRITSGLLARSKGSQGDSRRLTRLLKHAFAGPLRALVVLFALGMAGRILLLREPETGLVTLLGILVVIVVVWSLLRLLDNLVMEYSEQLHQRYPNLRGELVNFLSNLIRLAVIIITALYLLHDLGYDITTLLASLGIGGLAVAFAAKETIANVFGCISIIADDMFRQGDWIVTPNANGTVIDIGLRSTKVRTFDNAIIFVPNAYLAEVAVRNWSRRKLGRRILLTVGVEYGSSIAQVRKTVDDIRTMLSEHSAIADATTDTSQYRKQQRHGIANAMDSQGVMQTLLVYLDELGESSINIMVYCFSKSVDWEEWLKVKQDVILRCCEIVEHNGLSIAFPSRTLYLREDSKPETAREAPSADSR